MLSFICVRNFKLADVVELELQPGFTVLTGETGAGKSLIVDALGLILGDRANPDTIAKGSDKAEIEAVFTLPLNHPAHGWLMDHDWHSENECIVRRILSRNSSSRGFINGHSCPIQKLRELGLLLVDIHGQHAHQKLLQGSVQRQALDAFAGLKQDIAKLAGIHQNMQQLQTRLHRVSNQSKEDRGEAQLLEFQISELEELAPQAGEMLSIQQEHDKLAHGQDLISGISGIVDDLFDSDHNVLQRLDRHTQDLGSLTQHDIKLKPLTSQLQETSIQLNELSNDLRHMLDGYEFDPRRLQELDERMSKLHSASRKYQVDVDKLPEFLEQCTSRLESLCADDEAIEKLQQELDAAVGEYDKCAARIRSKRQKSAEKLATSVTQQLRELSLTAANFQVTLIDNKGDQRAAWGTESVEFQISTNPGQDPGPVAKVASGGELSRVALAINVVANQASSALTQVYDEVDVGIGGGIAEIVGQKLRDLADEKQVLCVTHLPQVASQGQNHLRVAKQGSTTSSVNVEVLEHASRTDEIARMLGGVEITENTRTHAKEMLEKAG
ncbi:MAG: DNA repair protein RecN (Recombination protein N) [Parasphingorhabdus sp.]|jgi:DNA repair protein RecN (Recombination protein N)